MIDLLGKRIRVSLENVNRSPIPEEYHYEFRNVILKKIEEYDKTLSVSLHDRWDKFFSFSGFLGKQWHTPLGLMFRNVDVLFTSPDSSVVSALKNAFLFNPKIALFNSKIIANSVRLLRPQIPDGVTIFPYETLGEIVIKKGGEDGGTYHVGANDDIAANLEGIIRKQYSAFSHQQSLIKVNITQFKQKKKAIVKNGVISNSFIALRLRFNLEADGSVHAFLLTQGIGHHRKMGFGTVEILRGS